MINKMLAYKTLLGCLTAIVLFSASSLFAQNNVANAAVKPSADQAKQQEERPNLFRELGLTPDQIAQIKGINIERKPLMEEATRKLREANKNLDMAIYADTPNEADVQARLEEYRQAQAEVVRLRFMSEFAVRKVLTPEQLVKFRDLRRKFAEMRRARQAEGGDLPNIRQMRRMQRQQNKPLKP
jgi:Spy/CpxP family protein refolding chaperone